MTSTTAGATATTSFAYNGDGLRNSRTVGANTTTFTWDVGPKIAQVLDDGAFKYVYGLERIAEVGPGTTTHYYLPDGLGSTMALVNSSGTVVNTYNYDVFGAVRSSTGTQANAFKFTGEQAEVLPVVVRLPLDPVVAATNLTGATVANLDEDPDTADTAWATATSVADTALRVGFPTPAQSPKQGPGLQEFRVLLRKNAAGGNNPTYDIELWETGGGSRLALLAGGVSLTSDTGVVVSATWDAALLGVANGANVEVRIVGHTSNGSPSNRRTVEVGAVEWNALVNATDETLEYLRARYYDMGTGRFVTKDRVSQDIGDGQSLNPFAYVRNNPAVFVDPSGLWCPKNPRDCIPNRETLSRLQKPTVLTLDVLAIGFQGASAVITDAATVAGCVAGTPAGPGGVLAGCMAGYLLGRSTTTGFRFAGNVASATSTAISCIPLDEKPPDKETKSTSFAKDCGFSLANTVISSVIQDPNVGLAADIYQFCRDLGKCGP